MSVLAAQLSQHLSQLLTAAVAVVTALFAIIITALIPFFNR